MNRTDAASTFVPSWFQPSELGADTPGDAHAQSFSRLWTAFMQARVLVALQMFIGVMYLALVVSRLINLNYVKHLPREDHGT